MLSPEYQIVASPSFSDLKDIRPLKQLVFKDVPRVDYSCVKPLKADFTLVRSKAGQLVAVGGISYADEHGQFGNLAVHPDHRHNGIAKFLINKRVERAKELEITSLYIAPLLDSNSLQSYYIEEHGFELGDDMSLTCGENPLQLFVPNP